MCLHRLIYTNIKFARQFLCLHSKHEISSKSIPLFWEHIWSDTEYFLHRLHCVHKTHTIFHPAQGYTFLTLSNSRTMMQVNPKVASHGLVLGIWDHTLLIVSRKPFDLNLSPSRPFSWEQAMITDVAEVKPTVTGIEIKSTKTPAKRREEKSYSQT